MKSRIEDKIRTVSKSSSDFLSFGVHSSNRMELGKQLGLSESINEYSVKCGIGVDMR